MGRFVVGILALVLLIGLWASAATTTTSPTTRPALPPMPIPSEPADKPAPRMGRDGKVSDYFMKMHIMFLEQGKLGGVNLLFMGDVLTDNWRKPAPTGGKEIWDKLYAPQGAANFGVGADKTQNVLWRIDHGELDGLTPKVVVLLAGANNMAYPADDILLGEMAIIQDIHQKLPNSKLLILGIFPRGLDPDNPVVADMRDKITKVNKGLAQLDDGQFTRFLDIGSKFVDDKGNIQTSLMPDGFHLDSDGYQTWSDSMADTLNDMMK
jgi:lysophospholipase L1-like esterase